MLILTLETCTDTSTMGLVSDGAVLAEAAFPSRYTLAKRMLSRLEWLLGEAGAHKQDIEGIAVSLGPGSFTGVRIGSAAAKTFAQWQHIPLVGIPTLEALAYPFRECADTLLVPVINARRKQAYTAFCHGASGTLQRITADLLLSAEPFADELRHHIDGFSHIAFIGQVEGLPPAFLENTPVPTATIRSLVTPHALAALGAARIQQGDTDDPMTLAPIYLRSAAD